MEWSRPFRAVWWFILVVTVGIYLAMRFPALKSGQASALDIVVFLVWIAVCLGPLFKEIELPGIKLKQEILELKKGVETELASLRYEISARMDVRSNISPNFWFSQPPPDSELPNTEEKVLKIVEQVMEQYRVPGAPGVPIELDVDEDVKLLFQARHNIEKELRHLAEPLESDLQQRRAMPPSRMLWLLTGQDVIPGELANAVREIYSVCSPAIHGEPVSKEKVAFVRETAPKVVGALRAISRRK